MGHALLLSTVGRGRRGRGDIRRRNLRGPGTFPDERLRFLGDLCNLKSQILLPPVTHHRDVCLACRAECVENFLPPGRIVELGTVNSRDEVTWTQAETSERLPVATGVNPEASLFALSEHRLGPHDLGDGARFVRDQLP